MKKTGFALFFLFIICQVCASFAMENIESFPSEIFENIKSEKISEYIPEVSLNIVETKPQENTDNISQIELNGYISVWKQKCSENTCEIPYGIYLNKPIIFKMSIPQTSGQVSRVRKEEVFDIENGKKLFTKMTFLSICPHRDVVTNDKTCFARYFQVQIEISGAVESFCAASLNAEDFLPFPVVICAGNVNKTQRIGITLHRKFLKGNSVDYPPVGGVTGSVKN